MNKPVAWIDKNTGKPRMEGFIQTDHDIPLYTHPAEHNLGVAEAIGFDKGYKSASVKKLTDKEILTICFDTGITGWKLSDGNMDAEIMLDFARAILRKAQE